MADLHLSPGLKPLVETRSRLDGEATKAGSAPQTGLELIMADEMGWRPIDTLDVASLHDDEEMLIHNDRGTFVGARDPHWSPQHGYHGGWWMISDGKDPERALRGGVPTHWMPLPSPPQDISNDRG